MKICPNCGQPVAEDIVKCPSCGNDIGEGRRWIDDYRIEKILHEGHASILCRAVKPDDDEPVMIRLFKPNSGVDEAIAQRLAHEIEELKKLPSEGLVRHQEIKRTSDGLWYRVSEWVDSEDWGDLVRSDRLKDLRVAFDLFKKIADILDILHKAGQIIPHLILNDILVFKTPEGALDVKIDYKMSRFIDPKLDQPPPMLADLISCHPDMKEGKEGRPLGYPELHLVSGKDLRGNPLGGLPDMRPCGRHR